MDESDFFDTDLYIRLKLIEKLAQGYQMDYNEMQNLLEDDKYKLDKKFNQLCEKMPRDKQVFDAYMENGFKDIKGMRWVYEGFKDICRAIYNINPCARRKYPKNLDSELASFRSALEKMPEYQKRIHTDLTSM